MLGSPGNHLSVDSRGNIIACDELAGQIDVFAPGQTKFKIISQGLVGCSSFSLNQRQNQLFVANQPHEGNNLGISIFDYPGGSLLGTITSGIPADDIISGVALSPAAQ